MSGSLVRIVVTEDYGSPDGYDTPTGTVTFNLSEAILSPGYVAPITVPAILSQGAIAQELTANDFDSGGGVLSPATTQYRVSEVIDGSPLQEWFATIPAAPPGSRAIVDGIIVQGTRLLVSATANFTADDLGAYMLLEGFPVGTTITEVIDAATVQLSTSPPLSDTGVEVLIGASVSLASLRPAA